MNPENFSDENLSIKKCKFELFSFEDVLLSNSVNPDKHVSNNLLPKLCSLYLSPTEACNYLWMQKNHGFLSLHLNI